MESLDKVWELANETLGEERAAVWMRRPTSELDGRAPATLATTAEGARMVALLLHRIAHGLCA